MHNLATIGTVFFTFTILLAGPAMAEKTCKPVVTATGAAAILESAAPKKARGAWMREVTARYGEFWNDWSKAQDGKDQINCGRAYKYFYRCEATARPCAESAIGGTPSASTCITVGQSGNRKCDDFIVQAQVALKNAGCNPGSIDGVHGSVTRDALRCFQKKNGLNLSGELDAPTARTLKLS